MKICLTDAANKVVVKVVNGIFHLRLRLSSVSDGGKMLGLNYSFEIGMMLKDLTILLKLF